MNLNDNVYNNSFKTPNQNPQIEGQTTQWQKEKGQKDKQHNGKKKKDKRTNNTMAKRRRTNNTMAKRKRTKEQTTIYKTLDRKLKIEQIKTHELH